MSSMSVARNVGLYTRARNCQGLGSMSTLQFSTTFYKQVTNQAVIGGHIAAFRS